MNEGGKKDGRRRDQAEELRKEGRRIEERWRKDVGRLGMRTDEGRM